MPRFVSVDHGTPMLLPPDLRSWLLDDHIVHFTMDAIDALRLDEAKVNTRGTSSAQYLTSMMLGLLIYCYATGTFSSRKIQALAKAEAADSSPLLAAPTPKPPSRASKARAAAHCRA
jgi:hypothetical protein